MIPIYKPFFNESNLKYAHDAINSGWVSSQGDYLDLCKNKLKEILNCKKIILTNNGTTATHLMAIALKYKHPNIKKIIVPNNVYVAAWNSFLFDKNYELVPIDANLDTWNFDVSKIEPLIDDETAILVVHNIGNVVDVIELQKKFPNTVILEDNCEGFLGKYQDEYTGTKSFASSISFFGNKTLTSGEGGAFITNDNDVFEYINKVKSQGQSDIKFLHDVIGYNYRMTNVQAALLYGQLMDIENIINLKKNVFKKYFYNLSEVKGINYQQIETSTQHSNWMFGVRFINFDEKIKKDLEFFLFSSGIDTRPMFYSINKHNHLSHIHCENKNANLLQDQCLILPSYPEITESQINYISNKIKNFLIKNEKSINNRD
jgi:perosamine synthetase